MRSRRRSLLVLTTTTFMATTLVTAQRGAQPASVARPSGQPTGGSSSVLSPSVMGTRYVHGAPGAETLDLLILWRGSPGWFRRLSPGGGGQSAGSADGLATVSIHQGGVLLTARFNAATRTVRILDEDVTLQTANVVVVDDVDGPGGPRIVTTIAVSSPRAHSNVLHATVMQNPELLEFLRCHAQIPDPMNRHPMSFICAEAIALGLVTTPVVVTPIPDGPVQNRAANDTPMRPGPPQRPGQLSSSPLVSPVVLASYFARREVSGANVLDLLVLWRGSPGWHLNGANSGGGGGGADGRRRTYITRGTTSLSLIFDPNTRSCEIQGKLVPLGDHNVVLVDDVDASAGARVIKTLRIDPGLPEPVRVEAAIRKSAELVAFLRCDLRLPNERQQATMDVLCARVK